MNMNFCVCNCAAKVVLWISYEYENRTAICYKSTGEAFIAA